MLPRDSKHRGRANYRLVNELASSALGTDAFGYRHEFLAMVRRAEELRHD
jgi:hypothetical protein